MTYQVNEIFSSIQGEGFWSGTPATFIRLQGCNVGCEWCDTKYTWGKGGKKMTIERIMQDVEPGLAVITGGEPMLHNLDELILALHAANCYTQIETSGAAWYKGIERVRWITWSPKPNLKWSACDEMFRMCREIKFVVDDELKASTVQDVWLKACELRYGRHSFKPYITLMPEGTPPSRASMDKALAIMRVLREYWGGADSVGLWRITDRLQFRLGVK